MFLNDVCDQNFDAEFRRERPIVSGALNRGTVITATVMLFVVAIALLAGINSLSCALGVGLTILIVVYDWTHKRIRSAPILMGGCRFLLYLTAAAAGLAGITARALFFAALLGVYIMGLSYLARGESRPQKGFVYPWLLLFAPIPAAFLFDRSSVIALSCLPLILCIGCAAAMIRRKNIGAAIGLLLAGIVLVDLIAISANSLLLVNCLVLFVVTLLLQKYIPAT